MLGAEYARTRIMSAATWAAYQTARRQVLAVSVPLLRLPPPPAVPEPAREYVAFHAWQPGWLDLGPAEAAALGDLAAGLAVDATGDRVAAELAQRGWTRDDALDLDAITLRSLGVFPALQNPIELRRFLDVVAARQPRVIVEIGTAAGGMFHAIAQVAPADATLVSIDLFAGPGDDAVCDLLPALAQRTHHVHVLRGSSLARSTHDHLVRVLAGRPIDLLFIDGDHSYGGTRSDFETFSPLVAPGGLVAMHDVAVLPENSGREFETGIYWRELSARRATELILDDDGVPGLRSQLHLPVADRRRAAFGIGLVVA